MTIFGVDVSRHQGTGLDWSRIKASGIDFMIARASLATTPDPAYAGNVAGARQAGLVAGAYHFLYPARVVAPVEQAQLFADRMGQHPGLLAMLDVEKDRSPTTGQVYEPDITDVRLFAREFDRLTAGHPLLIYAPAWYWTGYIGNPPAADLGLLCASRYVPVQTDGAGHRIAMTPAQAYAKVPASWWQVSHGGWKTATILQFTSTGVVHGYGGPIDLDAFQGTVAQLAALAGSAGQAGGTLPTHPAQPVQTTPSQPGGPPATPQFYTVVPGDTLSGIAARFGFAPSGNQAGYLVMINAFPENEGFRANPSLIHPGDRVRVE